MSVYLSDEKLHHISPNGSNSNGYNGKAGYDNELMLKEKVESSSVDVQIDDDESSSDDTGRG